MKDSLVSSLKKALVENGVKYSTIQISYPEDSTHGDYSTSVALAYAKQVGSNPRSLAEKIVASLDKMKEGGELGGISSISIAGPGFINFVVKDAYVCGKVVELAKDSLSGLQESKDKAKNVLIEHTDPNAFKAFHIGHLMANAIGESLSRLVAVDGSKVTKICYPSDIGLHIAKSVWAMKRHSSEIPQEDAPIIERTAFLGKMYVEGTQTYGSDPQAKAEIDSLNKKIYEKTDPEANRLYELGKKWSLDHYELLYKRLGTKFDEYIYESEAAPIGKEVVLRELKKGIFEESEGATIFHGEKYGLHTRVFLNSQGLTTYEAKDIGLNVTKFKNHPNTDESIIVTASEQNDYFKVIKQALTLIDENIGKKTTHIGHGMMRFASGKMSSRTGNVITAEDLISDIKALVAEKIKDREFTDAEKEELADTIAIGAIKYTILRQSIGSDIIFDSASSISFEGDSGPYLQYATVRAGAILKKAREAGIKKPFWKKMLYPEKATQFEKLITRFPEIVERAHAELAPQIIATYLVSLAAEFNSFYAKQVIVDKDGPLSPYYVESTRAFHGIMVKGLELLGIRVPERM